MNNKLYTVLALIIMLPMTWTLADEKDIDDKQAAIAKSMDLSDRAAGIHNGSNISLFFENYGIFSHNSFLYGDAGEFPANSNQNYLYLMSAMVGVAPDAASGRSANVIQSRYATSTDWMPVGGYHQGPATDIAFSDNTATWPNGEWFWQDDEGAALIVSTQDSYCVYNDDGNQNEVLGIQIAQTGYTFGLSDYEDMIFFTFELTNHSSVNYDSVYFGLYHDFDVGNDPGGANDYTDDMLSFDSVNDFMFVSDADNMSVEWDIEPGSMGIALLESPTINGAMAGITDMHYRIFQDNDSTQMALMSSNLDYLPGGIDSRTFFNTGASADIHYDDPGIIASGGRDIYGTISSGPFDLSPADTLIFIIGLIAGINEIDLYRNLEIAQQIYEDNFAVPKPPASPQLGAIAEHGKITLYWTSKLESELDDLSGVQDFEGYRLYKSIDRGLKWDQIDRNVVPDIGLDPIPFTSFDRINEWGDDTGLQYTYIDSPLIDGIEYWYSITAFDHGDSQIGSLESPIGNTTDAQNVISVVPISSPSAYEAASVDGLIHYGGGNSNYKLNIDPVSQDLLTSYTYFLSFDYAHRQEIGDPGIKSNVDIVDSSRVPTKHYGFEFVSPSALDLYINTTQELIYSSMPFYWDDVWSYIWADSAFYLSFEHTDISKSPSPGDYFSLNFSATLLRVEGSDTLIVMQSQKFDPEVSLVSEDGLILSLDPQPTIQNINIPPILDFEIEFEVADLDSIQELDYQITVTQSGIDTEGNPYLVLRTTDENSTEIGVADTLYNGWGIQYRGWTAWFGFDPAHPPPPGTSATFSTLPPIRPTIQDYYQFGIIDAKSNPDMLAEDMNEIRVVPNPYMAGSLWEAEGGSFVREPVRQIQFTNLPVDCEINIFTLSGDLIKTLEHDALHGTETWDLRAEGGREIVSGIYLYQVKSAGFEYLNRFAVIK